MSDVQNLDEYFIVKLAGLIIGTENPNVPPIRLGDQLRTMLPCAFEPLGVLVEPSTWIR